MPRPAEIDWRLLATKAMRTRAGFEALLVALDPWIISTSRMFCPADPQGAAQEARSNIFAIVFKQKRLDTSQSSKAINNYLCECARRQIRHEARRVSRNGMNCAPRGIRGVPRDQQKGPMKHERPAIVSIDVEHNGIHAPDNTNESNLPFPLPLYAEYLEHHGTIIGAAKYCEQKYGYDAKKVESEFKRVVATLK